jgi:hypothetical protein
MNPFSKTYTPVIKTEEVKANKSPKAKPNVFDTGTPEQRMAHNAKPLPTERKKAPKRPSTM